MSQRSVAQAVGVSQVSISRWEAGATEPSPEHRARIVALLNLVGDWR
jgi:transcriptional regulator with XRE-family HTH domain